jgi:predicted  nucleic acid-binding Zn-ribbon protein
VEAAAVAAAVPGLRDGARVSVLDTLLLVQEHDTALDRLRHRRVALPARSELAARESDVVTRTVTAGELRRARDEVLHEERRLDDEASSLDARAKEVEQKLYSGTVSSPRELQAMQADIDGLKRHRGTIEDRELEIMERREQLDQELAVADTALADAQGEVERLRGAIAEAEAEIDAEVAVEEQARDQLASEVPERLLTDYERRRATNRGAGAARLVGDTCQGCHLSIPSTEVERIRRGPEGSVSYCDNCGCILVPA